MPTATGGETIAEALKRLRTELARVEQTIARSETNGSQVALGGTSTTEIAYSRALQRRNELRAQIFVREARLTGSAERPGVAQTQTRMD